MRKENRAEKKAREMRHCSSREEGEKRKRKEKKPCYSALRTHDRGRKGGRENASNVLNDNFSVVAKGKRKKGGRRCFYFDSTPQERQNKKGKESQSRWKRTSGCLDNSTPVGGESTVPP